MFQGWITQFIEPVGDDAIERWAALMLPITLATLAVYGARLLAPAGNAARSAVVAFDRHRLGDRRFSSSRLWFSAFAAQSAAAVGIETHLEGDDVLDLELIAIQETMLRSTQPLTLDEDLEALEWLTGHFRREMLEEECESDDRPALSSCWIAFGSITQTASLLRSRSTVELRMVNAADLGQEAFVTATWSGRRGRIGRHRRPIVGLVRQSDPALLGDCVGRIPLSGQPTDTPDGRHRFRSYGATRAGDTTHDLALLDDASHGLGQRLLDSAHDAEVDGPLTDRFVSVVQAARLGITDTWGDHWWTTAPHLDLGAQSQAEVRCQLFTDAEPLRLREPRVADRDTTEAWT
ncbi:MAG: hypothetical protein R2733_26215 [Acidimicrobiales bacterium]